MVILTDTEFALVHHELDSDPPRPGKVMLGRIAGDSITFTPADVFESERTWASNIARLTDSRFLILYSAGENVEISNAIVAEVSDSGFSFGPKKPFHEARTWFRVASLTPTKCIIAFRDSINSSFGSAKIVEINGTDLTFGPVFVFHHGSTFVYDIAVIAEEEFIVFYEDGSNNDAGTAVMGQVSGNAISFGPKVVYKCGSYSAFGYSAVSNDKYLITYSDDDDSSFGKLLFGHPFPGGELIPLGIADFGLFSTSHVPVILHGVSSIHPNLETGKLYYALPDGGLTTATTTVRAGLAIPPYQLLVDIGR